jgi:hypothetical protein
MGVQIEKRLDRVGEVGGFMIVESEGSRGVADFQESGCVGGFRGEEAGLLAGEAVLRPHQMKSWNRDNSGISAVFHWDGVSM